MTELEKAARQALEALDEIHAGKRHPQLALAVAHNLRKALATSEPVPERLREAFQKRGFVVPNTLHEAINSAANIMCEDGTIIAHHDAKRTTAEPVQVFLVRDVAALLGASVPDVVKALAHLGHSQRSTNMEITPDEALAVAKLIAATTEPGELTRSQKLRNAGYTRRPSWKTFLSDADDVSEVDSGPISCPGEAANPATTEHKVEPNKDQIRQVFLDHGFTIKEGQTDLKPYVYDAAYALIALVQPATERAVAYFSYSNDDGFVEHATAEEARIQAEESIKDYRSAAMHDNEWPGEVDSVCWGAVLQKATAVDNSEEAGQESCDYELAPAVPASPPTPTECKGEPVAWMRKTDITEPVDFEPETDGWMSHYTSPQVPEGLQWFTVAEHGLPDVGEEVIGGHWYTDPWLKPEYATRFMWGFCRVFADDRRDCPDGKRWQTFGPSHNQITHWARINLPAIDAARKGE